MEFIRMYFNNPMCNLGIIGSGEGLPAEWKRPKMTLWKHLEYKFIMALEGNDVASNLKWVMSSGSIAVMPRPKYETWFMEGRLIAGYHYIEIRDDFSDLEEKINYYIEHEDEALQIVRNANEYVAQFKDEERELLISLAVVDKYMKNTGQIAI